MKNEVRLIDANALKTKIFNLTLYVQGLRFGKTVINNILESYRRGVFEEIDNAPTVDATPVVRCKDCKYLVLTADGEHDPEDCVCNYFLTDGLTDDDFCSRGERHD